MITKSMVGQGYDKGVVKLDISPHNDGVVCRIGDYWFYFGGLTAEEHDDVEKYKKDIPRDTIIDEIFDVLNDFDFRHTEEFMDEYNYYESILKESGCTE